MDVMRHDLVIPAEFAGIGVESDDGCGVKVIAQSRFGGSVGIARAPVNKVEIRIVAAGGPCSSARAENFWTGPCFAAGFAFRRHRVETPQAFACFGVVRIDEEPVSAPV